MLLICLYRSNELDNNHQFSDLIQEVEKKKRFHDVHTTYLAMTNLDVASINDLLLELLNMDDPDYESTRPLAELCHKRTLGNPLHAISFVGQLSDEKFLKFDLGKVCWHWDIDQILSKTFAMSNVVELMSHEMAKLPLILQRRLCVAACFGNSFQAHILNAVLQEMEDEEESIITLPDMKVSNDSEDNEDVTLDNWLSFSESCGFLEQQISSPLSPALSYQWVHDSVREGALALLSPEKLSKLKGQLGRQLQKSLSGVELESITFIVANLLHDGPKITDEAEFILFASINLEAAQKATRVSAFATAAQYASRGIDLLPEKKWETNKDLTLDLYTIAAMTEYMAGLREAVNARFQEVKARNDIPLASKLEVYASQIRSLCATTDRDDGIALALSVLEQQGIQFPKTTVGRALSTIILLVKVKKQCKEVTSTDLAQLPEMDSQNVSKMKLLRELTNYCYGSAKYGMIMPLAILTSARLTFKHGVSIFAPPNLAAVGVVFTGFLRSWLDPLSSCRPHFMKGYEIGLRIGDAEFASYCVFTYITSGLQTGRPLSELENDCRLYANQIRVHVIRHCTPYWLAIVRLIGCEEQTEPLLGDTEARMTLDELVERDEAIENLALAASAMKSRLYAIFGDHEAGAKLALERGDQFGKTLPAIHMIMPETFARGVSLYAMAIETKSRRYKHHARKVHATIRKWREAGNPNVIGYEKHLDAEDAVLRGKFDMAISLYHSAKAISSRSGLVQDAALAAERCGEMLLLQQSPVDAAPLLEEALSLYRIWGAHAKAAQLLQKHSGILHEKNL
ncbi:Transcriptional regulator [Seminavis robusta]|uniref:Transcriptional regulator n=1 Tax=Seminavis robusta TaxID=568900 RepID=A0A9N8HI73_9STRA|nr:Transcriptional regulator [Seminavis robusta]|eukprot:Sro606_g174500.1 Transcriptional regulator (798) ;mRNA; r:26026-28529